MSTSQRAAGSYSLLLALLLTGCGSSGSSAPVPVVTPPVVVPPKTPPVVVPPVVTLPAPTTGVMILTWVDPTENVNDTALTNLAGVKIYYDDTQTITIGLGQLIYEFTDVPIGNHCVSMTAFNTLGAESAHSPTVCEDVE